MTVVKRLLSLQARIQYNSNCLYSGAMIMGEVWFSSLGANPPLSSLPSLPLALEVGPIPSILLPPLPFSPVLPPLPLEVGPLKSS